MLILRQILDEDLRSWLCASLGFAIYSGKVMELMAFIRCYSLNIVVARPSCVCGIVYNGRRGPRSPSLNDFVKVLQQRLQCWDAAGNQTEVHL